MVKRSIVLTLSALLCVSIVSACDPDQPQPGMTTTARRTATSTTEIVESRMYVYPLIGYIEITEQADGTFRYHYNQGPEHLATLQANVEEGYDGFGNPLRHELHDGTMFSVYYSEDEHRKMQYEFRYTMEEAFEYHKPIWPHHKAMSYNEDLTEIRLTIDRDEVDYVDVGKYWNTYEAGATLYQYYNGVPSEDVKFIVYFVDADTEEVFERINELANYLGPG